VIARVAANEPTAAAIETLAANSAKRPDRDDDAPDAPAVSDAFSPCGISVAPKPKSSSSMSSAALSFGDHWELVLRRGAFACAGFGGFILGVFAVAETFAVDAFAGAVVHRRILRVAVDPSLTNYR
jgi:hypothetical protein